MTRRHPPLAERHPITSGTDVGRIPTQLVTAPPTTRIGGDGVALGVDPHGAPLGVRLFRPAPTRAVLVGSPRCAQLVAYRALATGARVVVSTGRPAVWAPLAGAGGVPIHPVDAAAEPARRTRPLLYLDDAPPYGRPPELPGNRWTTVLTLREALTHREAELVERADVLLLQQLVPDEITILKAPGLDQRLAQLPADALAVSDGRGVRWGRLSVTPIEHHHFGPALRR